MGVHTYTKSVLVCYDVKTQLFSYDEKLLKYFNGICNPFTPENTEKKVLGLDFYQHLDEIAASPNSGIFFTDKHLKSSFAIDKWYRFGIIKNAGESLINITITDITEEIKYTQHLIKMAEIDELTNLYTRSAFTKKIKQVLNENLNKRNSGGYAFIYFDIVKFKAINDLFGKAGGDLLLIHIGEVIKQKTVGIGFGCRIGSDRFAVFVDISNINHTVFIDEIYDAIIDYDLPYQVNCNFGIYITSEEMISVSTMLDRAILAEATVKGIITEKLGIYTDELRKKMLFEQKITGCMNEALDEKQIVPFFQPQYDHATGELIGAEALARWQHPEMGFISPGEFIPIFEKNGFITNLDMYIFERTCEFIRNCMDNNIPIVPISTNFSRYDIYLPDFVDKLELYRNKYNVPVDKIRIEITESAAEGSSNLINDIVNKLHQYNYVVEMDDFGSGFSSLNVLKDIDFDIIKLDMKFLSGKSDNEKGGTIISSVVKMATWLGLSVIAEGVETLMQADMLNQMGCNYIQGYLYSKPLMHVDFRKLLIESPNKKLNDIS